jgi:hypothetical protein
VGLGQKAGVSVEDKHSQQMGRTTFTFTNQKQQSMNYKNKRFVFSKSNKPPLPESTQNKK